MGHGLADHVGLCRVLSCTLHLADFFFNNTQLPGSQDIVPKRTGVADLPLQCALKLYAVQKFFDSSVCSVCPPGGAACLRMPV